MKTIYAALAALALAACAAPSTPQGRRADDIGIDPQYAAIPACSAVTLSRRPERTAAPYAVECHVR